VFAFSVFAPGRPCDFSLIRIHGNDFDLSTMHKQIKLPATSFSLPDLNGNPGLQCTEGTGQPPGIICYCPGKSGLTPNMKNQRAKF
jgi:hypothetical protein